MQSLVAEMNSIVALAAEPLCDPDVDVHVHQDAHNRLRVLHTLLCQPRRVLDGLLDVVSFKVWVAGKDIVEGCTMRDLIDDHGNRNSHPTNAGPPSHNLRIKRHPVKHGHPLIFAGRMPACLSVFEQIL